MNSDSLILQKVAEKDPKAAQDLKGWSHLYQIDKSLSSLRYRYLARARYGSELS